MVLRRLFLVLIVIVDHARDSRCGVGQYLARKKKTAEAVFGIAVEVTTQAQTRRTRSRDDVRAYFAGVAATAASALAASAFTLALLAL